MARTRRSRPASDSPSIRASRAEFTHKPPIVPIVLGAGIVGGLAYLLLKPSSANAAPMPLPGSPPTTQLPAFPAPPPSGYYPSGTGGITFGQNGADPSPALVTRLRGSLAARQLFAMQALAYSTRYTDAIPDGIEGPITDGIIQSTVGATRFSPTLYPAIQRALLAQPTASEMAMRLLPYTLPNDLIGSINQAATAMSSTSPLVQALPQLANASSGVAPPGPLGPAPAG